MERKEYLGHDGGIHFVLFAAIVGLVFWWKAHFLLEKKRHKEFVALEDEVKRIRSFLNRFTGDTVKSFRD